MTSKPMGAGQVRPAAGPERSQGCDYDYLGPTRAKRSRSRGNICDRQAIRLLLVALVVATASGSASGDNPASHAHLAQLLNSSAAELAGQLLPGTGQPASSQVPAHWQPSFTLLSAAPKGQPRSMNFSHLLVDEPGQSVYVGAANWLLQLSLANLRAEQALRTGPMSGGEAHWRDCAPANCQWSAQPLEPVASLPLVHAHNDLLVHARPAGAHQRPQQAGAPVQPGQVSLQGQQQQQQAANNYNKILAVDPEARQLISCWSLSQGACRKHQLGQLAANFSELIPLPVAANDEQSSSLGLVVPASSLAGSGAKRPSSVLYVAATNSRHGPYREMVPAISARYLDSSATSQRGAPMQIIERSFTDSARVDISYELRDYYLVNYVHSFQHQDYIYFVTVQRKSPLRQLEELGYITRLARLCLNDFSFQSYAEISLECQQQQSLNYNLIQDAHVFQASSHLANQLGLRNSQQVLAGAFAPSKDHTTKTLAKSAICLFPMDKIEQRFNENIQQCYNGSARAGNMNYIAGSVNECPKPSSSASVPGNFCNEPLRLNGSLTLQARPVYLANGQLISALGALHAPGSQVSTLELVGARPAQLARSTAAAQANLGRTHQVLLAGTGDGYLKRISLANAERGHEIDSISLAPWAADDAHPGEPVLADIHVVGSSSGQQYALAATSSRVFKLRASGCKFASTRKPSATGNSSSPELECNQCAQLQDPFCGWCASASTCNTRDECLQAGLSSGLGAHWTPFDQIRCSDYQPVAPQYVALQAQGQPSVEVNVRLAAKPHQAGPLALQLAQAQFTCHFDYLALSAGPAWGARNLGARPASATTKATQARLNLQTWTLVVGCPLAPPNLRPASLGGASALGGELRVKLSVRPLAGNGELVQHQLKLANGLLNNSSSNSDEQVEREIILYDCLARSGSCRSCLQGAQAAGSRAASAAQRRPSYTCSWCPLSGRCTFNASNPDFGCAASALLSTTPQSTSALGNQQLRAAHLASSLDEAQASVFGASLDRLSQCPAAHELEAAPTPANQPPASSTQASASPAHASAGQPEILVPNQARRELQVSLRQPLPLVVAGAMRNPALGRSSRLECWLEVEGSRARLSARLADPSSSQLLVVCQESLFAYQDEVATQRAQLNLVVVGASSGETQVIESLDVIIYKCHLFGVNPPALTSTLGMGQEALKGAAHSSAAWRHELLAAAGGAHLSGRPLAGSGQQADCSLCLNVERKYQCAWCGAKCQHSDQCAPRDLHASTCPPPRIDSIHPTSGPLEGGTLITIEGSNLGSNEREIQDKISVAGELCQLVMYSVSTRIVCKTGPSPFGQPQEATVFVGNRAGVTSAHEKFHYKSVHLSDVNPRVGPVSGGTRLYLSGSNLNVGSRTQIFLDDIPCSLDGKITSQQISCITAPNLLASSMRITRLALMIDNSTHYLPYPFTYQPDPIITSIEPAESFVSGGRLILISGQHLASPQSNKLIVYHEHKHNIINATGCMTQNDTLITCLTPAISRDLVASLMANQPAVSQTQADNLIQSSLNNQPAASSAVGQLNPLTYQAGGLKLKISLLMDDVRSVRNLDEYYHHLPHYLTYFEDPQLFKLGKQVIEYSEELVIAGENLEMSQLDQDMLIRVGPYTCHLKALSARQVVCEPPAKIAPVLDEAGRLMDKPLLPIVGLVGQHLKFQLGHMQYHSRQYQVGVDQLAGFPAPAPPLSSNSFNAFSGLQANSADSTDSSNTSTGLTILVGLCIIGFVLGFGATLIFAMSGFRSSKSEREYKRIQLQMGSMDPATGQPILYQTGVNLFENIHINQQQQSARSRALDYVNGALTGKKLFFQLNQSSFPPSPQTDISSLTVNSNQQQQHLVKLASNGTVLNSTFNDHQPGLAFHQANSNSSSQASPVSSSRDSMSLNQQRQMHAMSIAQRQHQPDLECQPSSRNFNWTQEAPTTIVPYAVIEACNLTLEGKNAIMKDYV